MEGYTKSLHLLFITVGVLYNVILVWLFFFWEESWFNSMSPYRHHIFSLERYETQGWLRNLLKRGRGGVKCKKRLGGAWAFFPGKYLNQFYVSKIIFSAFWGSFEIFSIITTKNCLHLECAFWQSCTKRGRQ